MLTTYPTPHQFPYGCRSTADSAWATRLQQEAAYSEMMGYKWDKPRSEQFDYTGHRRKRGNGRWESREEQIARLTGFTVEQLELVAA